MKKNVLLISFVLLIACLLSIMFNLDPGIVGLALIAVILVVSLLPKCMNCPFGKKQRNDVENNLS